MSGARSSRARRHRRRRDGERARKRLVGAGYPSNVAGARSPRAAPHAPRAGCHAPVDEQPRRTGRHAATTSGPRAQVADLAQRGVVRVRPAYVASAEHDARHSVRDRQPQHPASFPLLLSVSCPRERRRLRVVRRNASPAHDDGVLPPGNFAAASFFAPRTQRPRAVGQRGFGERQNRHRLNVRAVAADSPLR
jgi:hypothetical protein